MILSNIVKLTIGSLFLSGAGMFAATFGDGQGEFIPLRDGEILVGEIATHDEDGLDVKRLDNGGLVHLRWTQLAPPYERSLKTKLGYMYEQGEEVMIEADELTLNDGTKRVGRILSQNNDGILKDPKSTLTYTRGMLAGSPGRVSVPALDVFTRDELYNDKLASVDTTTAEGNLELARYLERINDFTRAIQHWNDLKRIDPAFHPAEAANALKTLEEKKARQDEFDFLQDIESQRSQRHWDRALGLCEEFPKKFPKSTEKTRADVEKRKKSIAENKHTEQIDKTWIEIHRQARNLARSKGVDRKVSLDSVKEYARGDMKKDMFSGATKILQKEWKELTEQDVQKLWKERGKRSKQQHVSYGNGTFILGKEGARKGLDAYGASNGKAQQKGSAEQDAMLKKLQALLQKQAGASNLAGPQQKQLDPPEDWWQMKASPFEREQFTMAWFAEFGGEMEDIKFSGRLCIGCGGQGGIPVVNTGGQTPGGVTTGGRSGNNQPSAPAGMTMAECPTCHGAAFERTVLYR